MKNGYGIWPIKMEVEVVHPLLRLQLSICLLKLDDIADVIDHPNQSLERTWVTSISNASYTLTLPCFNIRCVIIYFGHSPTVFTKNYVPHVITVLYVLYTEKH
jgi:hypothetical protein